MVGIPLSFREREREKVGKDGRKQRGQGRKEGREGEREEDRKEKGEDRKKKLLVSGRGQKETCMGL